MQHEPLPERFRRHALLPEEAQRLILECVRPLEIERVPLLEAWARRLAEPLVAPHPFPPFRRSGMDGYAIRAADVGAATAERPITLEVVESLPSGVEPTRAIGAGQAARIMTGGMVPEGADAVVMLEATKHVGKADEPHFVQISKPVLPGLNIADIGCEIQNGATLIPAGALVQAGESALLAACGYATVAVARRPRVGILSTGNELLEVGEPLAPAKIRNSNLPMLAAMIREAGAEPILLGQVPDDRDRAGALVTEGLSRCDLLLTTGGVSVGDYDVMVDVLAAPDIRLLFNKIAMRPGSPTTAALRKDQLIIALSGNPGACFVGYHLFVLPVIKRLQHVDNPYATPFQAYLGVGYPKVNAYRRYIRGRMNIVDGLVKVWPTGDDKSSLMTTIVGADCLIEIPPLKSGLEAGQLVTAWRLD
ncbi:gephyrin-like molybdotransferase Glp [Cohnella yongneupensis]|uniref:Molybdopterin molybdenumtransferase n=1 Tax=Cohnella yongneupensis TaxID=425006 RepID=A0ABW0R0L4_9BACL